jgi:2-phosphoglycerate kinase
MKKTHSKNRKNIALEPDVVIVKKRDGVLEKFDMAKLKLSMLKEGASEDMAIDTAMAVMEWVKKESVYRIVPTYEIKEKLVKLIAKKDKDLARRYKKYMKTEKI